MMSQLLASGRLGFHHRINRFSHVVLFGDYEKKVAMWTPPEQIKDMEWKHRLAAIGLDQLCLQ